MAEWELFLDLSFRTRGSHRFLCISHPWAERLASTGESLIHILNEEMNTYSVTCFHASLLCTISACWLEIIKGLILKMSSTRQVGFWWMTNRSIWPCVCVVLFTFILLRAAFHLYESAVYLQGEEDSNMITMLCHFPERQMKSKQRLYAKYNEAKQ